MLHRVIQSVEMTSFESLWSGCAITERHAPHMQQLCSNNIVDSCSMCRQSSATQEERQKHKQLKRQLRRHLQKQLRKHLRRQLSRKPRWQLRRTASKCRQLSVFCVTTLLQVTWLKAVLNHFALPKTLQPPSSALVTVPCHVVIAALDLQPTRAVLFAGYCCLHLELGSLVMYDLPVLSLFPDYFPGQPSSASNITMLGLMHSLLSETGCAV